MKFQFENLQQMFIMEGHGPYVWTAVLVTVAMMVWLIIKPLADRRAALKDVAADIARTAKSNGET
tara:strand:+ start:39 stop:233 length:195 start_codon:yes stop_codon:yes gene_type:complete